MGAEPAELRDQNNGSAKPVRAHRVSQLRPIGGQPGVAGRAQSSR
ncbi:hypothetical protein FTUN_4593 [Frigoriglobus tundricola]|uniref:Uncharacterized protein n=1 Tax=Frigoriglobus tundricola TaxID=2774151 RepID=A0A6M5YUH6_9BACT|nr:hypothetical protein FTUN_4593 [Frigoriglobus tundricola]